MSAGSYDIVVEQGATFRLLVTWEDPAETPIDLSGYSARLQARQIQGGAIVCSMTTQNGAIVLGGDSGTVTLELGALATAAIPAGIYRYDIELESGGGEVTRLLRGQFIVQSEVTR